MIIMRNKLQQFKSLINMLPDSPKKDALLQKLSLLGKRENKRGKGATGLQDTYEFKPHGHIKIESIDANGNVLKVLQDKDNLVVNGADEIAIKAMSGDPDKILYRNRTIKPDSKGVIHDVTVYIDEKKLHGEKLHDAKGILHAPNVLWEAVNENDFITDYSYYPNTLYIREELSTEPGKRAFSISEKADSTRVPLVAEIYSTYTNLFIGLGDGEQAPVQLDDKRFTLSKDTDFTRSAKEIETKVSNAYVEFKDKITQFAITLEKSKTGGQVEVLVNGVSKQTIETFDSSLETPEVQTFEFTGFDDDSETTIKFVLSGKDEAVSEPVMKITRFECDALDKSMNSLMAEFKNFETKFLTPTSYNTSAEAPYTVELPHKDVIPETLVVMYDGETFEHVDKEEDLAEHKVLVDALHGVLTFDRALSNVLVSYEITGKIFDGELVKTMTAGKANTETIENEVEVTGKSVAETPDGVITKFTLPNRNIKEDTLVVTLNGTAILDTEFVSKDLTAGTFELTTAPAENDVLVADYTFITTSTASRNTLIYKLEHPAKAEGIHLFDENGNEFTFVEDEANVFNGKFAIDSKNPNQLIVSAQKADGTKLDRVECVYASDEVLGIPTNYRRAIILKPKTAAENYPWFNLDKGSIQFVAEFPEESIKQNVTIREMGLFDGPRVDDNITGFYATPVKAFSLVRTGETLKDANTGVRITWTITLLDENNNHFTGGNN